MQIWFHYNTYCQLIINAVEEAITYVRLDSVTIEIYPAEKDSDYRRRFTSGKKGLGSRKLTLYFNLAGSSTRNTESQ